MPAFRVQIITFAIGSAHGVHLPFTKKHYNFLRSGYAKHHLSLLLFLYDLHHT